MVGQSVDRLPKRNMEILPKHAVRKAKAQLLLKPIRDGKNGDVNFYMYINKGIQRAQAANAILLSQFSLARSAIWLPTSLSLLAEPLGI